MIVGATGRHGDMRAGGDPRQNPYPSPSLPGMPANHDMAAGVSLTEKKKKKVFRFPKKARGHSMCSTMVGGSWRLAVGGSWRLAVGNWRLVAVGGGWWLAVGGGWWLAVGGGWQLMGVGGWRLVVPWGCP